MGLHIYGGGGSDAATAEHATTGPLTSAALSATYARRTHLGKWLSATAARGSSPAKVLVLGDSISEGVIAGSPTYQKRWTDLLQKQLRQALGLPLSSGYMPAYYADAIISDDTTRGGAAASENNWQWGLGGKALTMPGTTGDQATLTWPAQTCTKVRIWYGKTNFLGGNFTVKVDGVDVTASGTLYPGGTASGSIVACAAAAKAGGFYWESPTLTEASHTVVVTSATNGAQAVVNGAEFFQGDESTGVRVYDGAHSGAKASDYVRATMDAGHWQDVALLAPQLVLVNLGTNDATSITASQFQTDLTALVAKIQANAPDATTVLVKGWRPGTVTQATWDEFNAAKDAVADATADVVTFDLAAEWPTLTTDGANNQGLMYEATDPVHPNSAGHQRYADVMTNLIAPATAPKRVGTVTARLAADTAAVNASTVLVGTNLRVPVAASLTYDIEGLIWYDAATAADLKVGLTVPAGASGYWVPNGLSNSATSDVGTLRHARTDAASTGVLGGVGAGTIVMARIVGQITIAGSAGEIGVQFAQNASDASGARLRAGSWLRATPV